MKPEKFVDLVEYQSQSIVSRQIIEKKTGSVTVFSFDKDQALKEHITRFDAFVYIIDGKAEIMISGKPFLLQTGESIVMPANQPHAVKALERFKMCLVMILDEQRRV